MKIDRRSCTPLAALAAFAWMAAPAVVAQDATAEKARVLEKLPRGARPLNVQSKTVDGRRYTFVKYRTGGDRIEAKGFREDGSALAAMNIRSTSRTLVSPDLRVRMRQRTQGPASRIKVRVALRETLAAAPPAGETTWSGRDGIQMSSPGRAATRETARAMVARRHAAIDMRRDGWRSAKRTALLRLKRRFPAARLDVDAALQELADSVVLELTPAEIERLAATSADFIAGIEPVLPGGDELASAMQNTRVDPWALAGSQRGEGIGIYQTENGCPNYGFTTNYYKAGGGRTEHSEDVTAVLRAVSPKSYVRCRNGEVGLPAGTDLAGCIFDVLGRCVSNHPRIYLANMSYGILVYNGGYRTEDRDWDNFIYREKVPLFKSAGNSGTYLTSPAQGLNVVSVGVYDDDEFDPETRTWGHDVIEPGSSYLNPQTHNEKPDFVAPGVIDVNGHSTWGTSFAAPHAAGIAADLMSSNGYLKLAPSLLRARMYAGATTPVKGSADQLGLGGIDYYHSSVTGTPWYQRYGIFYPHWWQYADYANNAWATLDSRDVVPNNGTLDHNIDLEQGVRYRIAIAWMTRGSYTYAHRADAHPIGIDFDLSLTGPGSTYQASASWDNPFEVIDFIAPEAGRYRIQVNRFENRDTSCKIDLGIWASAIL